MYEVGVSYELIEKVIKKSLIYLNKYKQKNVQT